MSDIQTLPDGTRIIWAPVPKKRKVALIVQIVGELALTTGIVLLLFIGYKTLVQDTVVATSQEKLATVYNETEDFIALDDVSKPADIFARMYVPRFGQDWTRLIGEGTRWHPVLNEIGVGRYSTSSMPGEVGNFAVAGHRGGFGGAFRNIDKLVAGDRVYIETKDTWFVYKYLESEIVKPTEIGVIADVPAKLDVAIQGGSYLTMTSCTPIYVNTDRFIVWFELETTSARIEGTPYGLNLNLGGK